MKTKNKQVKGKRKKPVKGNLYNWGKKGESWKELLNVIQPAMQDLLPNAQISRERWDVPDIQIEWSSPNSIGRAIQIIISTEGRKLVINGSAWKDSNGLRRWKTEEINTIPVSGDLTRLLPALQTALKASISEVSDWTEVDLDKTDSLPCQSCS
jgi:hypothetical protein